MPVNLHILLQKIEWFGTLRLTERRVDRSNAFIPANNQINRMLSFTGDQGRKVIEIMYPRLDSPAAAAESEEFRSSPLTQTLIHHVGPQVIQFMDTATLVKLATTSGGVIEMLVAVGDTVVDSTPVLRVFGAAKSVHERALTNAIGLGE